MAPLKKTTGQGLLEVIMALAIFGLLVASLASMVLGGFRGNISGGEHAQAEALAQEGIEAVRAIRDRAWNENRYAQSAVEVSGGQWIFNGVATEQIDQYTRTITFTEICRDETSLDIVANSYPDGEVCRENGTGNIIAGAFHDAHTKQVNVEVSWQAQTGVTNVEKIAYITNWDSRDWRQDTEAEFTGGTFTDVVLATDLGDGDGALILSEVP